MYEETGYEIPDGLITEEDYIEFMKNEQKVCLKPAPSTPLSPPPPIKVCDLPTAYAHTFAVFLLWGGGGWCACR